MTTIKKRIENLEERNQKNAEGPMTIIITMHRADGPRTIICGEPGVILRAKKSRRDSQKGKLK